MDRLDSPDPQMQPDPAADDAPATVRMPLPEGEGDWVPAPASWSDATRRRQTARADAHEGLRQLARMVEPVLRPASRVPGGQPVPVDIDLPLIVEDASTGWGRLPDATEVAEAAVNDAFRPMDLSMLGRDRLNSAGVRFLDGLPESLRPIQTATRHPHIVNKMAVLWHSPQALRAYFDELLLSTRPARRGFSLDVMAELFGLQRSLDELGGHDDPADLSMRG